MLILIEAFPLFLLVLLLPVGFFGGPNRQGTQVTSNCYSCNHQALNRDTAFFGTLALHIKHHATESVVLMVSGVCREALVGRMVGRLRPSEHSWHVLLIRLRHGQCERGECGEPARTTSDPT